MASFGVLSGRTKAKLLMAVSRPAKSTEDNVEKTKATISDDITLYTTKIKEPLAFVYELTSTAPKGVRFTMNFSGSVNFAAVDGAGKAVTSLSLTGMIPPNGKVNLGTVNLVDSTKGARLEVEYDWEFVEPDAMKVKAAVDQNMKTIDSLLKGPSMFGSPSKSLFVDPDFKPVSSSLYTVNPTIVASGEGTGLAPSDEMVAWYRPSEFYKNGTIDVFEGKIEPGDILQGSLGDCWFLCSVACLAEFPVLVEDLFQSDSKKYNPNGKYNLRLCQEGSWETITVDDFIPCYPEGGPLYAKGHGNELWVMLLEKAYAKLCGSYAALKAGWAFEAMIDLTGAPYWTVRFDDSETKKMVEDGSLWSLMLQNDDLGYIQSASTPGEDVLTVGGDRKSKDNETGLVAGHAYALIAVKEVKSKGLKLVQLRNPWGEGGMEWNGDWSDSSPLWTAEIQRELGITDLDTNDGSFWMCFSDFIKYFFSVNACLIRHVDMGTSKWFESRKKMSFSMSPEGEVRTPSYLLTLTEASDKVYFSMHQQDIRHVTAKPYIDFGVTVLQLNASTGKYTLVTSSGNSADRQNQTKEMSLPAGQYLVIPTSTGCRLSWQYEKHTERCIRETCDCIGTIDAKKHGNPYVTVTNYDDGHENFIPSIVMVLTEIFVRFDYDEDGVLNRQELSQFLQLTEGWNSDVMVPDDAFEWFLTTFANTATLGDTNECMGLSLSGFIASQLYAYVEGGRNAGALFRELGM